MNKHVQVKHTIPAHRHRHTHTHHHHHQTQTPTTAKKYPIYVHCVLPLKPLIIWQWTMSSKKHQIPPQLCLSLSLTEHRRH